MENKEKQKPAHNNIYNLWRAKWWPLAPFRLLAAARAEKQGVFKAATKSYIHRWHSL